MIMKAVKLGNMGVGETSSVWQKDEKYSRPPQNRRAGLNKKGSVIPNFEVEPELPMGVFQLVIEDDVRSPALQVNRP